MPPRPEASFPPDYRSARKAFIAACTKARADTISRAYMGRQGPDGKPVFVDSVALGPRDARRGILVIANNADASSAVTALLQKGVAVPEDMRLVVVHAFDPFAFMNVPGDPVWSRAMLKAIATEDLSRVTQLTVLSFGNAMDELPAIFSPDRKIRLTCKQVDPPMNAAKIRKTVEAEFARPRRGN